MNPTADSHSNAPGSNPWRSSYHHGGAVLDASRQTSFGSTPGSNPASGSDPLQGPSRTSAYADSPVAEQGYSRPTAGPMATYTQAEAYETSTGCRVDLLAAAAYLSPLPAALLLIVESRNDFVRIHAYQSLLLAIPLVVLHFLLLASHFLQTILFLLDVALYLWLGYQAYCSAESLQRDLLPIIGPIAEQWTAEE